MRAVSSLLVAAILCLLPFAPAFADAPVTRNIGVFGDSLGDGVWSGLYTVLKSHPEEKLFRHSKVGTGLTRVDYATWFADLTTALDNDHIDIAVVMVGANDQQSIRDDNHKGYLFQSEGWTRTYTARVDAILAEFARRKVTAIWIGLPIMRKDELNTGAAFINHLLAAATSRTGAVFLPLFDDFKGPDGGFASHLPDANGRLRQVRLEDGVHFTGYGYELVAAKVYAEMDKRVPWQSAPSH
jgi:hypothetical protein